ncbi:TetR/AcrR family transcriptional regulator [Kineococcus radiotolerans]|uniref:Transcriptional regulator, TetR family n=1 Tax=Kineococcus radiotolerans (strain ATCC BAA-149 / DSM 14245 / SRS30216) TaxID=266940 RepID=A6W9I6_KINRD|nr:TetR/AcrR family transcriptional regulator [Kineococcus radiotolerans]ABS03475.1 transcriptional regulator, TetR family [Kineococcus radiotolerans SRS30216 = ATCC BAA-149]
MEQPEPSLRRQRVAERRAAIRTTALHLFERHGFARVTVEEIARQAGVSHQTVFRHFATKEDLVLSLADTANDRFVERVAELGASAPVFQTLATALTDALTETLGQADGTQIRIVQEQVAAVDSIRARAVLREGERQAELVELLVAREDFGPARRDEAVLVVAVFGAASVVAQQRWRAAGARTDDLAQAYVDVLTELPVVLRRAMPGPVRPWGPPRP